MNYKVSVKIPNKLFIMKNKQVRSPFEAIISESELRLFNSRVKFYGLQTKDFQIESLTTEIDQKKDYSYLPSSSKPYEKPRSITSSEPPTKVHNKTSIKETPIKKHISQIKKREHKVQETILNPGKLFTNSSIKPEQNINEDIKVEDTNITIEELSIKSSSILDKFLNSDI